MTVSTRGWMAIGHLVPVVVGGAQRPVSSVTSTPEAACADPVGFAAGQLWTQTTVPIGIRFWAQMKSMAGVLTRTQPWLAG